MRVLPHARRLSTPIAFVLGAVLASAGTATAAALITGAQIQDNTVGTNDITNNSLTGTDIRNGTLDGYDLKPSGIAGGQIADRTLTGKDLALGSVTGAEVADGSVGAADLAPAARSKVAFTRAFMNTGPKPLTTNSDPVYLAAPLLMTILPGQSVTLQGYANAFTDKSARFQTGLCSSLSADGVPFTLDATLVSADLVASGILPLVSTLPLAADAQPVSVFIGACARSDSLSGASTSVTGAGFVLSITNP